MLSSRTFMILIGIVVIFTEVKFNSATPVDIEDYYNTLERNQNVIDVWSKSKSQVDTKQLLQSIKKWETLQRQNWLDSLNNKAKITTTTTTEIPTTEDVTVKTGSLPYLAATHEKPSLLKSLHEQMEHEKKRFFHSAIDGWVY